jgi:hypothetical protein
MAVFTEDEFSYQRADVWAILVGHGLLTISLA